MNVRDVILPSSNFDQFFCLDVGRRKETIGGFGPDSGFERAFVLTSESDRAEALRSSAATDLGQDGLFKS
jgi:hypothetical protein